MNKHKNRIFELRAKGYSYKQIQDKLGCSKGTISFHLGDGQKEKSRKRNYKYKNSHPFKNKIERFSYLISKKNNKKNKSKDRFLIYIKVRAFFRIKGMKSSYSKPTFTVDDVINKFGTEVKCYLTGQDIDISKPRTYHFDHIIPRSKGGDNSLENLGICTREANQSKFDMTKEEYLQLCKTVLEHNGFIITPK